MCCFVLVVGVESSCVVPRPSSRTSVLSTVVAAPPAFVEAGVAVVSPFFLFSAGAPCQSSFAAFLPTTVAAPSIAVVVDAGAGAVVAPPYAVVAAPSALVVFRLFGVGVVSSVVLTCPLSIASLMPTAVASQSSVVEAGV